MSHAADALFGILLAVLYVLSLSYAPVIGTTILFVVIAFVAQGASNLSKAR